MLRDAHQPEAEESMLVAKVFTTRPSGLRNAPTISNETCFDWLHAWHRSNAERHTLEQRPDKEVSRHARVNHRYTNLPTSWSRTGIGTNKQDLVAGQAAHVHIHADIVGVGKEAHMSM